MTGNTLPTKPEIWPFTENVFRPLPYTSQTFASVAANDKNPALFGASPACCSHFLLVMWQAIVFLGERIPPILALFESTMANT